jgi:hypothetical protein
MDSRIQKAGYTCFFLSPPSSIFPPFPCSINTRVARACAPACQRAWVVSHLRELFLFNPFYPPRESTSALPDLLSSIPRRTLLLLGLYRAMTTAAGYLAVWISSCTTLPTRSGSALHPAAGTRWLPPPFLPTSAPATVPTHPPRPPPSARRPLLRCCSGSGGTLRGNPACSQLTATRPCQACPYTGHTAAHTAHTSPGHCRGPGTTAGRNTRTRMATGGLAGSQSRGHVSGLQPAWRSAW